MTSLGLISLRSVYLDDEKVYPPLGLLYLKAAVNKELPDVNVELIDDYNLDDISNILKHDYIGMSVMTPQREESSKLLRAIKRHSSSKGVIIGGPHAKHYFIEAFNEGYDYVVPDDGQRSLVKILRGEGEKVERDKMGKEDWIHQPRPDRTSKEARDFLSTYHYELQGRKAGTMLCATGCPERCTFCEDAMTAVRWRNLEDLTLEMDDLLELDYTGVYLFDDLFAIAMPKSEPIARELKKRDLIFRCNGQARYFTKWGDTFAKMLAENGCVEIAFGHETGSQKILDNINKRTTIEQNYQSIKFAKKYGINVKSFILLGLPGEDWSTLKDTESFIRWGGMDDFQCAIYYPYKGTQIRDAIEKKETGFDLTFEGEGLGAYGQKGGKTEAVVRTESLSREDLLTFRNYLVDRYQPKSHSHFFDSHLASEVEYE